MEPVTTIVTALALGAAAGSKSVAEKAVKEGYEGLKTLIQKRYQTIDIKLLEQQPESEARQSVLVEDLTKVKAEQNQEILERAKILIDSIQNLSEPETLAIGVKVENLKGLKLNIEDINATGTGIGLDIKEAEIQGDINIKGISAGRGDSTEKKT